MAERPPVEQIRGTAQLNPVATPVDAYVQPGRNKLLDFAESLQKVSAPLSEFLGARAEKAAKEDLLRGQAKFYSDRDESFAEAVRTGKIPPQYSPAFVRGWKLAQGSVAGGNLREQFAAAYDAWEGKNSEDPVAFDQFYQDFLRTHLDPNADPAVLEGLLPSVREIEANGRSRHIEYRAKVTYDGALEAGTAGVAQDVDAANSAGLTDPKGTDYAALYTNIFTRRKAFTDTGGLPEDFDNKIMTAMSLKIVETRDPELLKFFDQRVPGKSYTYGETAMGMKIKAATIENLETMGRSMEADEARKQKALDDAAKDNSIRQALDFLSANPGVALPDGLMKEGERYTPDFKAKIAGWREDLNKGFTNNEDLKAVYTKVVNGGGQQAVIEAMTNGVFGRTEDLTAAMNFAKSYEDNQSKIGDAQQTSIYKDVMTALDVRTKGQTEIGDPITGLSNEGFEAQYDFERLVTEWVIRNPDASMADRNEAISKIGKGILDRIAAPDLDTNPLADPNAGTYERGQQEFSNPYTDGTGPAVDEGLPQETDPKAATEAEVNTFLDNMTPEQEAQFNSTAEGQGITPQALAQRLLDQNEALRPIALDPTSTDTGTGDAAGRGFTAEQAGAMLDQAFSEAGTVTSGGQQENLRSLIRQAESGGDYDAWFNQQGAHGGVTQMTVDEVLALQQRARRNGEASTAAGAYGFLYKTVQGLKEELGLEGDELMDKRLQDRMADALLERRGLSKFRSGAMSKRQFALSLSQEFAALPNPNTGRSFYAGDGLNAARTSRAAVYSALGFAGAGVMPAQGSGTGTLSFAHQGQAAIRPELRGALEAAGAELGLDLLVTSGYRSPGHAVERRKRRPGLHSHRMAADISMKGMTEAQRRALVQSLIDNGVKRFIAYSRMPDILHVDLKDQRGDGSPYFMFNKSALNMKQAPGWFRELAGNGAATMADSMGIELRPGRKSYAERSRQPDSSNE